MSDRDWSDHPALRGLIATLAAIGMLALVGVVVLAVQEERHRGEAAQTERYPGDAEQLLAACLRVDSDEGAPSDSACEEAREQSDLHAQQSMATAAWSQFVANLVGLGLLAATVFYAHGAWKQAKLGAGLAQIAANETKRQADIAHTQLIEARQPVLYVDVEAWDTSGTTPGRIPTANMYVINLGDRLAIVTGGRFALFYGDPSQLSRQRIMDDALGIPSFISIGTHPLRTGEALRRTCQCVNFPYSRDNLLEAGSAMDEAPRDTLYLAGWVEYSDQWGYRYEQPFLVMYSRPSFNRPQGEWAAIPIQGTWPEK